MKPNKNLAYVVMVICGLILAAGVVLVTLQWAQRASFNLYGYPYNVDVEGGRTVGGVNTALLMLLSVIGGIVLVYIAKGLFWAIGAVRQPSAAQSKPPGAT